MNSKEETDFLEERYSGIGGSDCKDLLEIEPDGCRKRLWFGKRRIPPDYPPPEWLMRHAKRGKKLEPIIGEEYEEITGREVVPGCLMRHPDYPLLNHMDFFACEPHSYYTRYLEVKCPSYGMFKKVKREGLPPAWIAQIQQGILVGQDQGVIGGAVGVMHIDTWTMIHFDIEPDPEMQEMILRAAEEFWPLVENGPEPEGFPSEDPRCRKCGYRFRCHGDNILIKEDAEERTYETAPEFEDLVKEVIECQDIEEEAHELTEASKENLKKALGAPRKIRVPGAAVNYLEFPDNRWDTEALNGYMAKYPDVGKMFAKFRTSRPKRQLRIFRI